MRKIAPDNHGEVENYSFAFSLHFPGAHSRITSVAKTDNILSDCNYTTRNIISALRKNSRSRAHATQWRNNDFTPSLIKVIGDLRERSFSRDVFLILSNFRLSHSASLYCFARHAFYSAYLDTLAKHAKSVTLYPIIFPTLELLSCIIIAR